MSWTYERTHPFLTFSLDTRQLPATAWMLLGEARSKCEHIAGVPLQPDVAAELYKITLAKGVHATTAIEGNTLSAEDVEKRIEGTLRVTESKAYLVQEVDNILEALNSVIHKELQARRLAPLCVDRIKQLNGLVLRNLTLETGVTPGEIRRIAVGVGRYKAPPANECELLLERMCKWLNGPEFEAPEKQPELITPIAILKAILAHLYLAWIHPFGDGNGRTARLIEVQILAMAGVPDVACQLLSNHYNETRAEYYRQLHEASASGGNVIPFIEYALKGFVDCLSSHIQTVRNQQWNVSWINYVHERFKKRPSTPASDRIKKLVLALSEHRAPVPRSDLKGLTPHLAQEYAKGTDKTLSRDINQLIDLGLVRRQEGGFVPCREIILAFLPLRNDMPSPRLEPESSSVPHDDSAPSRLPGT